MRAVRVPPMERVAEGDTVGVLEPRGDTLSDIAELAERESRMVREEEEEEDTEGVSEKERVCEGVAEAHAVEVAVEEAERLPPAVRDAEGHSDWVRVFTPLREAEVEAVPLEEGLSVKVAAALGGGEGEVETEGAVVEVGTTRSTSAKPRYSRPSLGARTKSA